MGRRSPPKKPNWTTRRDPDLTRDLDILLGDLRALGGFINGLSGEDLMVGRKILSADSFACAVLNAESMDPGKYGGYRLDIAKRFSLRYGPSVSRASHASQLSTPR
jgi:hypothetical protein